jgi:SAM-dependent methyltransferase
VADPFFDGLLAEGYDALYANRDVDGEIRLVLERAGGWLGSRRQLQVLDVGCGTGQHLRALIKHHANVVGIDVSAALVEIARKTVPDVRLEVADIRTFGLGQRFDLVLALFGVFDYLWRIEDVRAGLRSVAMHLRRDGMLYMVVSRAAAMDPKPQTAEVTLSDGSKLLRCTTPTPYDADDSTVKLTYDFLRTGVDGAEIHHQETHVMRAWTKTELQLFLGEAGFRIEHTWSQGAALHVLARRVG